MDTFSLLITFGVFGIFIVVIAVMIIQGRAFEKKEKETLAQILSDPSLQWDPKKRTFQWQGRNYRYEKHPGSKNSPPSFSVVVECAGTGGEFEVAREGASERFFKNIGLTHEVQTGEEAFDRQFYIASNAPQFTREYFASSEKREAARRFFDMAAEKILHQGKTLCVTWSGSSSHQNGIMRLKETMEGLAVLAKDFPAHHEEAGSSETGAGVPSSSRVPVIALAVISLAVGVFSVIGTDAFYPPLDPWALFAWTLKFSIPALAAFLFYGLKTLAGHSRSHRDFLLVGALALGGFLLSGYGLVGLYNGKADTTASTQRVALIVRKEIHTHKRSKSYHFYIQSWKPGRRTEELKTGWAVYKNVASGKNQVLVYTKPGKLGFEWRVGWKLLQETS